MLRMLLLVVVLAAVWFLWKAITDQKAAKEAEEALPGEADPATPRAGEAAETAECPVCRAYVPITAEGGCGREDCPIPELAAAMAEPEEPPGTEPPAGAPPETPPPPRG